MSDQSSVDKAKDFIIFFLAGLAMIIGMVILGYVFAVGLDHCVIPRGNNYTLTPEELEERRHAGDLTKRAGLAGILPEERARVIRHFFQLRTLAYSAASSGDVAYHCDDECKTPKEEENETKRPPIVGSSSRGSIDDVESRSTSPASSELPKRDQNPEDLCIVERDEVTCPICLNEYVNGDAVITGTNCSHIFHMECCMQWLEKDNSHCAYCRKKMMKPMEFLLAAREVLGDARVDKIIRINENAARRLAEYEAAMASGGNNHTENSIPFVSLNRSNDHTIAVAAAATSPSPERTVTTPGDETSVLG